MSIFKNKYLVSVVFILLIATFLRFYNYDMRWGIAYDQAHDALVARHAVASFKLPLLGPFSSAGPFQTGGEWYWLLMIPTALYPYSFLSPWVFMTLLYVVFVLLMIITAYKLEGRTFSLLVGFFAAISTAQIAQGVHLTNQSPQSLFSVLAILCMVQFLKTNKRFFLFLTSFCVGFAASIHLQGVALIMMLVVALIFKGVFSLRNIVAVIVGLLLPMMPIFIYDVGHDFFNIKNMIQYYLYDQYAISLDVLGRRWLIFGGVFMPSAWANILGGQNALGYLQIAGVFIIGLFLFLKNKLSREWTILIISTFLMVSILRYTRTPLFDSYLVFAHPFVILLSSFLTFKLYRIQKIIGLLLFFLIAGSTLYRNLPYLQGGYNYTNAVVEIQKRALLKKYPNKKFAIYDHRYAQKDKSLPLVLFLDVEGKISDNGHKIGVYMQNMQYVTNSPIIKGETGEYQLVDLDSSSTFDLSRDEWGLVNPSEIYRTTEEWYTKK